MVEYLLLGILFLAIITMYLYHKIADKGSFDQVVYVYLWITVFHVSNTLIYFYFFREKAYVDWAAPFGLCYGPLFYFAQNAARSIPMERRRVFLHASPFALFYIAYFFFVSYPSFRTEYEVQYFLVLYSVIAISMVAYCVWGVFYKGIENTGRMKEREGAIAKFIASSSMFFWVMALLLLMYMYNSFMVKIPSGQHTHEYVYSIVALILAIAFQYTANRLVENVTQDSPSLEIGKVADSNVQIPPVVLYQKSAIPERLIDNYGEKLTEKIKEQVYLDPRLTLDSLAAEFKMTKHHLTQLLNLEVGQSFSQYINGYRVEYACKQLKDPNVNLSMEELAHECGFNSKSSFNRNFKNLMGCTPSQFRINEGCGP